MKVGKVRKKNNEYTCEIMTIFGTDVDSDHPIVSCVDSRVKYIVTRLRVLHSEAVLQSKNDLSCKVVSSIETKISITYVKQLKKT